MKEGVILAGGKGTRMGRVSEFQNKHSLLVYDKLMLEYPLRTLGKMGCTDVVIVSSPETLRDLCKVPTELPARYVVQQEPLGSADALGKAEDVKGVFPVLCGDVYFDPAPEPSDIPTLYWHEFEGAQNHSVWDPETNQIIEKPVRDIGRRAIVAYYYDERVFDVIRTLEPTERGELELIDLHNFYLQNGADVKEYRGFFQDMGTPDGLLAAARHERARQLNRP